MKRYLISILNLVFVAVAPISAADPDVRKIEFFEKKVRPVLVERCFDCHSEDSVESELRLDSLGAMLQGGTRGPAIVLGDPKQSLLVSAINHSDRLHMPPKQKLPRKQIADITEWIRGGAAWPNSKPIVANAKPRKTRPQFTVEQKSFWAFQSPTQKPLPNVRNRPWLQSPIDAFVLARLEQRGFRPAKAADKRTLIRRATFDLIGIPPTVAEVHAFLADESPNAFATVIDRLLSSPHYGERWGRHWLDVARYADSNGLDENLAYANAFRYRDYVVAAFNKDKPYDRFVQEQVAGDLITAQADTESRIEGITATGFLSIGAKMLAEDDPVKMQMDIIDEQVDTIGRAFMGLTFGCARCHDHKFDPISTADYYSLAGIFKSTTTMENFKVVARWQERQLASPKAIEEQKAHTQKIEKQKQKIEELTRDANQQLLANERKHLAEYLVAAEDERTFAEITKNLKPVGANAKSKEYADAIVIEAEEFARGNVKKDFSGYGKGIGVIYNKGEYPNFAEYDLELKAAGAFQVELRYAAAAARPVKLFINENLISSEAAGKVTGTWYPESQTWAVECVILFKAGKNTIRLERQEPFPHFDKILVVPSRLAGRVVDATRQRKKPNQYATKPDFVSQFVAYLAQTKDDVNSPFAVWNRFVAADELDSNEKHASQWEKQLSINPRPTSIDELAVRYTQVFAQVEREWKMLQDSQSGKELTEFPDKQKDSWRKVLFDAQGPFAVPKSPERFYSAQNRTDLKARRRKLKKLESQSPTFPVAMAVSEGTPQNVRIHIRGSHVHLGSEVPRQFPEIFAGHVQSQIKAEHSGRLELGRWLSSVDHPLTARVMLNRIWQGHFGKGLVRSPDNFGRLGDRPTHPQLLDWLAVHFMEQNWSIKTMHRLIMQSSTYRMSTSYNKKAALADPDNRLLWRMNRRRLEAEAIRDSIFAVAETLDSDMGGSLLKTENRKYVTSTANVDPVVYENSRRSIYLPVVRSALYNVFQAFDFADPSVLNGKRSSTTVAPQALFMMNSELVANQTREMATRLLSDLSLDDADRVRTIFERVYSRLPSERETNRALEYIRQYSTAKEIEKKSATEKRLQAWQSLTRIIIASNEFIYVE